MCKFFSDNFNKPQLIPTLFIIASSVIMTALGVWQTDRLVWKNKLIEEIVAVQNLPALEALPENIDNLDYRKVKLSGIFRYDKALHMIGRQHGNFPGYFIITPFELESDGRIILVNRGFSPSGKESKPEGIQIIEGVIRPARKKRFFAPENIPEKNIWFYENINAMSKATEISLTPLVIEAVGKEEEGIFPIPNNGEINIKNDHLGYAITWFSMVVIGLIMFGFYYRKTEK